MAGYCKVVIIDDEYIMRQGMKHMLDWEKEGYQIVGEASNGQEGLEVIEKTHPNIVLADIVMPVLDGIEFSEILQKKFPEMQLIILSSYDKFEYVKTTLLNGAVDYILKPTLNPDNLLRTLQKAVSRIPGMELERNEKGSLKGQVERFLSGYQEKLDEVLFAECFPHTLYRVMGINLKKLCGNQKDKMLDVRESVFQFFQDKEEYVHLPLFLEEEILCYIFNFRIKDEKMVLADIETCVDKMARRYENVFFVAGNSFSELQSIRFHYQEEIKDMVEQQFYYKDRHLLIRQIQDEQEKEERFPFEVYSENLSHGRFRNAIEMLRQYINYLVQRQVEEYRLKNLTKNLLYNYLMEIEKYDIESRELRQIYFHMLDQVHFLDEFEDAFEKILGELEKLRIQKLEAEDVKILEIKKYMKEHYQEALELTELAERFGFNYHYLSSYFSKHTREGFSGYLNKIRIEKACELLQKGTLSISEISALIGYSDHSYFCRVFKKITGNTPSYYKRQLKRSTDEKEDSY